MNVRTINATDGWQISVGAGNVLILKGEREVDVIKPPLTTVRLTKWDKELGSMTFGSVTKVTLSLNGFDYGILATIFTHLTGVDA